MTKFLLIPTLLLASLALAKTPETKQRDLVDHTTSSIVRVTSVIRFQLGLNLMEVHEGVCTGFVIAPKRVLTAGHCYAEGLKVDGQEATPLKVDRFYDLMLLSVETRKDALLLREDPPRRFEPLTAIGYARGWDRVTVLEVKPFLINFSPRPEMPVGIFTQGGFLPGQSGGPVVDEAGEVVGIILQTNEGVGYSLGTQLMEAFLLGVN